MTSSTAHLNSLDGLRGVAALLVVISHAANAGFLPSGLGNGLGIAGVMFFFLLSGFLMAYLYLARQPSSANIRAYAVQRMGRVLPLFYCFVIAALLFSSSDVVLFPELSGSEDAVRHFLFLHGTSILWTVPVEVQFYILFAVIWTLRARGTSMLWLFPLCAVSILAAAYLWTSIGFSSVFTLPYWLHWFVIGAAVGSSYRKNPGLFARFAKTRWATAAAWILPLLLLLVLPQTRAALGLPAVMIVFDPYTLAVITACFLCSLVGAGPFKVLSIRPLRWLGSVSYGVYLTHLPVLLGLEHFAEAGLISPHAVVPLLMATTLAVSALSLRFFERPAQAMFRRLI